MKNGAQGRAAILSSHQYLRGWWDNQISHSIVMLSNFRVPLTRGSGMMEQIVCQLSPRWRIDTDGHQWIIKRCQGEKWRSVGFVASSKAVLIRVLDEAGARLPASALETLDALPGLFDGSTQGAAG